MTSTVAEPVTNAALDLKLKLLLARLLVSPKKPLTINDLRKGLGKALGIEPSTETMQDWIDRLRAQELIDEKRNLTEAGRRKALEFLGVENVPPKTNWNTIATQYLVPLALGVNPKDGPMQKKLSKKETLAALLLKRQRSLPASTGETLHKVLEAIVCRELGYPEETTLKGVQARKLEELIHSPKQLTAEQAANQVPAALLKTGKPGVSALRYLVLREWVVPPPNPDATHSRGALEPLDQDMFARTVLAVARSCPTGWFGDNKVFINHVHRHLIGEPAFQDIPLDEFKRKLVEANRTDRLTLSRADLVSEMPAEDVRQSETRQLDAVFHFILVQKERP
jgi:hypothetical protein